MKKLASVWRLSAPYAVCVLAAGAWLSSSEARASCAGQPIGLLWSYPVDGATDVPTNALFWFAGSAWNVYPTVTLNGVAVDVAPVTVSTSTADPGGLEPDTSYTLELSFFPALQSSDAGLDEAQTPRPTTSLSFRTARGPAERPEAPTATGHRLETRFPDGTVCTGILVAQGCFDTGWSPPVQLLVEASDAIGWYVHSGEPDEGIVWPASCGVPGLHAHFPMTTTCLEARAIGWGGLLGPSARYCFDEIPPVTAPPGVAAAAADGGVDPAADGGEPDAASPTEDASDAGQTASARSRGRSAPPTRTRSAAKPDDHGSCSVGMAGAPAEPPSGALALMLIGACLSARARARRHRPRQIGTNPSDSRC